ADVAYDAVVVNVPLPPALVSFDATGANEAIALVRTALTASSAGAASPFVREATAADSGDAPRLRVGAHPDGYDVERSDGAEAVSLTHVPGACFRILRPDGTPVTADVPGDDAVAATKVVDHLEHIARWEQLRGLGDHDSRLRDAVQLDL